MNLEAIGVVAELVPTTSPFQVGMSGRPKAGLRPFHIVGRLQMSTGSGTWDEWYLAFDDGRYGWLAEAQGQFFVTKPVALPSAQLPEWDQIHPGVQLNLPPYGTFAVQERWQANYVSAQGELPFAAPPGSTFFYVDLSGDNGTFATLDYGDDPGVDSFFVGRSMALAELGIPGLAKWQDRKVSAKAAALNCPSCGGALALKDPQNTVRIACQYCGSLLGEAPGGAGKFEILQRLQKVPLKPEIPIGAEGSLLGRDYAVLGLVGKSTSVEGTKYYWGEYLLKEKKTEAYHWLAVSNGHWTLLEPVPAGEVSAEEGAGSHIFCRYKGRRYRCFQRSHAVVEAVLGEFYWEVKKGESTGAVDYVEPPYMLSEERTANESNWTAGVYVTKDDLEKAFGLKEPLAPPTGIGANQPWPLAEKAQAVRRLAGRLLLATVGLYILFQILLPKQVVYRMRHELPANKEEAQVLTETLNIKRTGNVEVSVDAPTDNTWVGVQASLINQASGEVWSINVLSDYFHGVDGGESWSEGARSRDRYISHVPAGDYVLRIEPEYEVGKNPPYYDLRVRSGVPRFYRFFWVLFFLSLAPIVYFFKKIGFETARWAESDFSATASSDDSSSDD